MFLSRLSLSLLCLAVIACGDDPLANVYDPAYGPTGSDDGVYEDDVYDEEAELEQERQREREEAEAAERERERQEELERERERQRQEEENNNGEHGQVKDPPEGDCEDTRDLIYVIDRAEKALYLYDPVARAYEHLGELDCGPFAGDPGSMSVSRSGYAYVRYRDNTVYSVDLRTMECEETDYESDFGSFGMGFVTEHARTWEDHLYVANARDLAVLKTETWEMTTIGRLPSQSELTGNGRGELWAMLPLEQPAKLARLSQTNGTITASHDLPGFPNPREIDTFAFATWGGEFFLFVRSYGMGRSTDVYRVDSQGNFSMHQENSGRDIVGAGVSTCAPVE